MNKTQYKIWYLQVDGGGAPVYLIIAPDRETAWELAQAKWAETYKGHIGSSRNWHSGGYTEGNSIDDIKDTGMYADLASTTNIVDLNTL